MAPAPSRCRPSSRSPCAPRTAGRTRGRCPSKSTWTRPSCSAPIPSHHLHVPLSIPTASPRPRSAAPRAVPAPRGASLPPAGSRSSRSRAEALVPPGMCCELRSPLAEPTGELPERREPVPERDSLSPPARSRRGPAALRAWLQRWAGGSRLRWGMENVCSLLSFDSAHPRPPTLG